jgi:hypothetical protein
MQLAHLFRRTRLVVFVAAASMVAHGPRAEDRAGAYRAPPLGTEFFVSDTGWFRVVEALPDAVTTENADQVKTTWLGGLVTRDMPAEDRARLMRFFPLTPGTRFAYELGSAPNPAHRVLTVVADDVVQVGSRAIPVVRVTRHQIDVAPRASEGEYTLWFAPEYGFPLKLTYRHIAGDAPKVADWQVVHIVPPGSIDGVWQLNLDCHGSAFFRMSRAVVRDGVIINGASDHPSTYSGTDTALSLTRTGDQLELKGTMMNAGGEALTISARGTLTGGSASGVGSINTRTGCPFTAARR